MAQVTNGTAGDVAQALRDLLKAGLALGVAEASRRVTAWIPPGQAPSPGDVDRLLDGQRMTDFVESVRNDPSGLLQLVKEVWSRGDAKERRAAAHALGAAMARLAPHRALGLTRELAAMASNTKEADLVGQEAIAPMIDSNPPFFDRVKQFLLENEPWIRRAAMAGLVAYATRRKKKVGAVLEIVLLVAESHEKEIRAAVKWAVRELSKADWKATAQGLAAWAKQDPTGGRAKLAKQYVAATAADARVQVERFVFKQLGRIAAPTPARGR
jgi:3-methyladenine DNA glycosylase AlkD